LKFLFSNRRELDLPIPLRGFACAALLELPDHAVQVGIAGAEASGQPIPTTLGDPLAVSDNLELAGLPGRKDGFNVEALLDEGHETRDLDLVILSRRAVNDLDLHLFSEPLTEQPTSDKKQSRPPRAGRPGLHGEKSQRFVLQSLGPEGEWKKYGAHSLPGRPLLAHSSDLTI
jgi:hypothetical protein